MTIDDNGDRLAEGGQILARVGVEEHENSARAFSDNAELFFRVQKPRRLARCDPENIRCRDRKFDSAVLMRRLLALCFRVFIS